MRKMQQQQEKINAFLEKPAVQRTKSQVQSFLETFGPFFFVVPFIAGFITLVTAVMGPSLIPNRKLSLLEITSLPDVHVDASEATGIWFGEFSACYRINGSPLSCQASSLYPDYNQTLTAALDAGLPNTLLSFLPKHLIQTPAVLLSGFVFCFTSLPFLVVGALVAWAPRLRIPLSLRVGHWIYCIGIFWLFWGWTLALSGSLAQENQFGFYAESFSSVARVSTRTNTVEGFQYAKLGGSFAQQWIGYSFLGLCIPIAYIQHLMWPVEATGGTGGYWIGGKA